MARVDDDGARGAIPDGFLAFPGWQVLAELGRGAGSVVYRVRGDDGDFAVKVLAALLARADAALYAAKQAGRNRVRLAPPPLR